MSRTKLTRDHHLWTRDTVKNVSGDVKLDLAGDLTIEVGSSKDLILSVDDGQTDGIQFKIGSQKFGAISAEGDNYSKIVLYEAGGATATDYLQIDCQENGETFIDTEDGGGSTGHLHLRPDGDLNLTPSTGNVTLLSSISEKPQLTLENTTNDTNGSSIKFLKDKGAAGANSDVIGSLTFYGDNDAQQETQFASIVGSIQSAADGAEGGELAFNLASHDGEIVTGLSITDGSEEDEIEVTIASGTNSRTFVSGTLSVLGDTLTMRNATSQHPQLLLQNTNADANGADILFFKDSASTADNDSLGIITWKGKNDAFPESEVIVCKIEGQFLDVSDGAEKGRINLDVAEYDGTLTTGATIFGTATNGQVDVTLGAATTSTVGLAGKLQVAEVSSPSAPADGAGGYLYTKTDGKPYWISNEVSETDLSASGGGGSSSYHWSMAGRARTQYNNWYWACHTTYGWSYYYFFYSTSATSLPSAYPDSYAPGFIVPVDSTVTGYNIVGNSSTGDTWEFAIMKGAQPTFGSAGDWSLSQIGSTQSAGGFSLRLYKWEETGLSVAVSKNDMIMPVFRRTTDNDSSYAYNEFSMNVTLSPS